MPTSSQAMNLIMRMGLALPLLLLADHPPPTLAPASPPAHTPAVPSAHSPPPVAPFGPWLDSSAVPFNQYPFLMPHDAATGYLSAGLNPIHMWAKTQSGGFRQQAACGARAWDIRPSNGRIPSSHAYTHVGGMWANINTHTHTHIHTHTHTHTHMASVGIALPWLASCFAWVGVVWHCFAYTHIHTQLMGCCLCTTPPCRFRRPW
jgi:hypothetical protein